MDLDCFQAPELFGFVPSESFGFPVLANSNFLLPDCFCASPICFLRFSNDSFSVASCFSASERNFINTNWKHQSGFFWGGAGAQVCPFYKIWFTPLSVLRPSHRQVGWKQELLDENIENMPSSLDSLSRLEDKGQNLNYKQLRPTSRRKFKEKNQYFISLMWFKDCFVLIYFIDNSTM